MLSDRERATLDQLQERLLIDDPGFARSFRNDMRRLGPAKPGLRPAVAWAGIVLAGLLCLLMLVAGAGTAALFFAVAAGALVWVSRRRQHNRAKSGSDLEAGRRGGSPGSSI
jgi:Flp pilus assembly protein TadB